MSEQFVYFNDDVFLNAPVLPETFFRDGLPCDNNVECMRNVPVYSERDGFGIYMSVLANIGVINAHFDRRQTVRQSPIRWYGRHLGKHGLLLSIWLRGSKEFIGFQWRHYEQPFLKSVLEEAWNHAYGVLLASCNRFRKDVQLNPYFFRYWQFASNMFYPVRQNSEHYNLRFVLLKKVERELHNPKWVSICLNDTADCPDDEFEIINIELPRILEQKFPKKSSYEK